MFILDKRVYFDDTDGGGVLYHANYIRYMDHARSAYLESLGFELNDLMINEQIVFAVVGVDIKYRSPARLSDTLQISAKLNEFSKTRLYFEQEVRRIEKHDAAESVLLSTATVTLACVNPIKFKPCALPDHLEEKFNSVI